jgi:hypothetical protein
MSLGKTFTNAIVREIGRNYGKAISNSLLGDSHSTPVRMVGGGSVSRMRGRTYRNKLDEAIEKFTIKGTVATFNAGINIHSQYFTLVEEANSDGVLDIDEITYLIGEIPRTVGTMKRIHSVMMDNEDQKRTDKIQEKIDDLMDFVRLVDDTLVLEKLPQVIDEGKLSRAGALSIIGLDMWALSGVFAGIIQVTLLLLSIAVGLAEDSYLYPIVYLILYNVFSAIFLSSGYFGIAKKKRAQDVLNSRFRSIKIQLNQIREND